MYYSFSRAEHCTAGPDLPLLFVKENHSICFMAEVCTHFMNPLLLSEVLCEFLSCCFKESSPLNPPNFTRLNVHIQQDVCLRIRMGIFKLKFWHIVSKQRQIYIKLRILNGKSNFPLNMPGIEWCLFSTMTARVGNVCVLSLNLQHNQNSLPGSIDGCFFLFLLNMA